MAEKTKFGSHINKKRTELGMSIDRLGKLVGVNGSTISKWINANMFPKESLADLAVALSLNVTTVSDVEKDFLVKWRRPYKSSPPTGARRELEQAIAKVDRTLKPAFDAMTAAANLTKDVFQHMGEEDFFIATTVSSFPLIFQAAEGSEHVEMFNNRVSAIRGGALFALIMPAKSTLERFADTYRFAEMTSYDEMLRGWDGFRSKLEEKLVLGGQSHDEARRISSLQVQRFECTDLPLTGAGWTVSLLGMKTTSRTKVFRTLVRSRFPDSGSFLLLPEANHGIEQWMRQFSTVVFTNAKKSLPTSPTEESQWRGEFIDNLLTRMKM